MSLPGFHLLMISSEVVILILLHTDWAYISQPHLECVTSCCMLWKCSLTKNQVEDVVEMDEKYIAICHKGTLIKGVKPENMALTSVKLALAIDKSALRLQFQAATPSFTHSIWASQKKQTVTCYASTSVKIHFALQTELKSMIKVLRKRHCDLKHLKLEDYTKLII